MLNSLQTFTMLAAASGDRLVNALRWLAKLPTATMNNSMNLARSYLEFIGKALHRHGSGSVSFPNRHDVLYGKFSVRKHLTFGLPVLLHFVGVVVALGSDEQMIRLDARRVITGMQHIHAFGNGSMMYLPRESVSVKNMALKVYPPLQPSVTGVMQLAGPQPAAIGFLDVVPKTACYGFWGMRDALSVGPRFLHAMLIPQHNIASQNFPVFMAIASGEKLLDMLVWIVVIGLICWLLIWLLDFAKVPEPFNKVGKVLLALIAVVLLIRLIIRVTGVTL